LFFVLAVNAATAQQPAYWNDIAAFKKQDSAAFPGTGKILFVGSSSFTKWTDVQNYFPAYPIINRGFGGSTLVDVIRYENEAIFPYRPKQIVIYCGENDVANDSTVTGKILFERFKQLFTDIRKNLPGVSLAYISIKPSPSRWHMRSRTIEGNRLIEKFLKKKKHTSFISVWNEMLGADGQPREELFVKDRLHMTADGYKIWQRLIEPYLLK
jgi:lysophospholipase L1-like esterase